MVANLCGPPRRSDGEVIDMKLRAVGVPLVWTQIRRRVAAEVSKKLNQGLLIVTANSKASCDTVRTRLKFCCLRSSVSDVRPIFSRRGSYLYVPIIPLIPAARFTREKLSF